MSTASTYAAGIRELASTMATKGCVWFVGAGFSIPSRLPGVTELSLTILRNALFTATPPDQLCARYDTIKRALLGDYPARGICLAYKSDETGIRNEIDWVEAEWYRYRKRPSERPQWLYDYIHLGRIAEAVHRTATVANDGDADIELAACMGFKDIAWENEPSFAHHLFALLVMEGLIPQIITLNYDDQIEQACATVDAPLDPPIRSRAGYAAGRWEGKAALFKIHGCRTRYLDALVAYTANPSDPATRKALVESCQALVVTDRQLQHWRDSRWAWARDLFQDLLRWRPFLFIGFSASDLVLQATLNALAEEVGDCRGDIFVAPSLSFPFYQFLSQMDPNFDPVSTTRVLPKYSQDLLPELYPIAIEAHFAETLRDQAPLARLRSIAMRQHHTPPTVDMKDAYAAATSLLSSAARQVAEAEVQNCKPRDPDRSLVPAQYIRASTARRLMHKLDGTGAREYLPLQEHKEEYRRTAQVLAIMLATSYPDAALLTRLTCTVDAETDNVVMKIADPLNAGDLRRVVLVPEAWDDDPAAWLGAWMRDYFERRWFEGRLSEGTHTVIHPHWLSEEEMKRALGAVPLDEFEGSFHLEVYAISHHKADDRGKNVV